MKRLSIVVSLGASLLMACDGSNPRSPTEPGPTAAAAYTLSGVVTESTLTGQAPVRAARVEVMNTALVVATLENGFYSIHWVPAGPNSVRVSAQAYETVDRAVTIDGDTRLDVQIARLPTHTLSGVVFETTPSGKVPVAGVHVEWGKDHVVSMTDSNGFYSLSGVYDGDTSVIVNKEGYVYGRRDVTVNGETRFDIEVFRE